MALSAVLNSRTVESGKVSDRRVNNNDYGRMLPRVYGSVRHGALTNIWALPMIEKVESDKVGSFFGIGGTTVNEYSYYGTWSSALNDGIIENVGRIWADGKIIRDPRPNDGMNQVFDTAESLDWEGLDIISAERLEGLTEIGLTTSLSAALSPGGVVSIHPGTQSSAPEVMRAATGEDRTPSYKGTALAVFNRLPLTEEFGNRFPAIEVEVISTPTGLLTAGLTDIPRTANVWFTPDGNHVFSQEAWDFATYSGITGERLISRNLQAVCEALAGTPLTEIGNMQRTPWGDIIFVCREGDHVAFTTDVVFQVDGRSLDIKASAVIDDQYNQLFEPNEPYIFHVDPTTCLVGIFDSGAGSSNPTTVFKCHASGGFTWQASITHGEQVVPAQYVGAGDKAPPCYDHISARWWTHGITQTTSSQLYLSSWQDELLLNTVTTTLVGDALVFDQASERLLMFEGTDLVTLDPDSLIETARQATTVTNLGVSVQGHQSVVVAGTLWIFSGNGMLHQVDLDTGALLDTVDLQTLTGLTNISDAWYDHVRGVIWFKSDDADYWYRMTFPQVENGPTTLDKIVAGELAFAGYGPSEYDVTALAAIEVWGFLVVDQEAVGASIDTLKALYKFDLVPSSGVLTARLYDRDPDVTIDPDHLLPLQDGIVVRETRAQATELPRKISLTHLDPARDYQPNTQHAQRYQDLVPGQKEEAHDYHVVMSASEAADIVTRDLQARWHEAVRYEFELTPRYIALEAGDIVNLTWEDGGETVSDTIRLTEVGIGVDFTVRCQGVPHNRLLYQTSGVPDDASWTNQSDDLIPWDQPVELVVIDTTALRGETDDDAGLYFGFVRIPEGDYPNATETVEVFRKGPGDEAWTLTAECGELMTGVTEAPLPSLANPQSNVFDRVNSIFVRVPSGKPPSETEAGVLDGGNLAIIADEVIQYQTVTDLGTNRYRLDNILRGRFGTDWAVNSHTSAGRIIFLGRTDSDLFGALGRAGDVSDIGQAIEFVGRSKESAREPEPAIAVTPEGRALKPWAAAHAHADFDGTDINLTWERRTRFGGNWQDGTEDLPLNEDSESWEVDVILKADGSLVRTLTSSTPSATYTDMQMTVSDGVVPADVEFIIYQISATVGRGFPSPTFEV